MPPRNSRTKAFRKYRYVKSPTAKSIPYDTILNKILKPYDAVNNPIFQEFEKYKQDKLIGGIDPGSIVDSVLKSDEDGDSRYVNKRWYINRAKGFPDDYNGS